MIEFRETNLLQNFYKHSCYCESQCGSQTKPYSGFTSHWPPSWLRYRLLETCWAFPVGTHGDTKEKKHFDIRTAVQWNNGKHFHLHTQSTLLLSRGHTDDHTSLLHIHKHTSILAAADSTAAEVAAISCSTRSPSSPCCSSKPRGRSFCSAEWTKDTRVTMKVHFLNLSQAQWPNLENVTSYQDLNSFKLIPTSNSTV